MRQASAAQSSKDTSGFLRYYGAALKGLADPAGPLVVAALYSFAMVFPSYHPVLFRLRFSGRGVNALEGLAVDGVWYAITSAAAIGAFAVLCAVFPRARRAFPRHRFGDFGWRRGRAVGWRDALLFYLLVLPLLVFATFQKDFMQVYPLCGRGRTLLYLAVWEAVHLLHMFGWEAINRGFLLFGLEERMGRWAVLAAAIPFTLLHIMKPELEVYGSFVAALALGWLALRARSFLPGVFLHWSAAATLDVFAVIGGGRG